MHQDPHPATKRPLSITLIGLLFIATGGLGMAYHGSELWERRPFEYELILVCLVRLLAVVGGSFAMLGRNWARWLLALWMGFHFILSFFHSATQVIVHGLLFGLIAWGLFRAGASDYFGAAPPAPGKD